MTVFQERLENLFAETDVVTTEAIMEALYVIHNPQRSRQIKARAKKAGFDVRPLSRKEWIRL